MLPLDKLKDANILSFYCSKIEQRTLDVCAVPPTAPKQPWAEIKSAYHDDIDREGSALNIDFNLEKNTRGIHGSRWNSLLMTLYLNVYVVNWLPFDLSGDIGRQQHRMAYKYDLTVL